MKPAELFDLIASALASLELDPGQSERDKRVYLAYVASRIGQGSDGMLERRLTQLREELGL